MNFENIPSNKHSHKRPSMILIHSYEMSKTGKSETESKLDFSDSGTSPSNCMLPLDEFFFFLVIQCERKVIKVNIEQLLFALNQKVETIKRKYQN